MCKCRENAIAQYERTLVKVVCNGCDKPLITVDGLSLPLHKGGAAFVSQDDVDYWRGQGYDVQPAPHQ